MSLRRSTWFAVTWLKVGVAVIVAWLVVGVLAGQAPPARNAAPGRTTAAARTTRGSRP